MPSTGSPTVPRAAIRARCQSIDSSPKSATAGVLLFTAHYNFARSLASGAVSIVAPVFRLSFAITVALAVWLLDERLTGRKLAGLAASLAAVWLLLAGGPASAPRIRRSSSLHALVATTAMGMVNFTYKLAAIAGGSPATVLTGQASVFLPPAALFALTRDRGFHPPPGAWRHADTAAVLLLFPALHAPCGAGAC